MLVVLWISGLVSHAKILWGAAPLIKLSPISRYAEDKLLVLMQLTIAISIGHPNFKILEIQNCIRGE